jgi:putative toxin-antitoxin system antitoxin component (TIGR02293 family)
MWFLTRGAVMTALEMYVAPKAAPVGTARRLGALMGLPDAASRNEVTLARSVAEGLPVAAIDRLAEVLGRAAVIGPVIPETSYRRALKAGAALSRDASDRVYGLSRVVDAAARVYHADRDRMLRFLAEPHPLLDGFSPLALATAGADAVVALIESAEAGFPV